MVFNFLKPKQQQRAEPQPRGWTEQMINELLEKPAPRGYPAQGFVMVLDRVQTEIEMMCPGNCTRKVKFYGWLGSNPTSPLRRVQTELSVDDDLRIDLWKERTNFPAAECIL